MESGYTGTGRVLTRRGGTFALVLLVGTWRILLRKKFGTVTENFYAEMRGMQKFDLVTRYKGSIIFVNSTA